MSFAVSGTVFWQLRGIGTALTDSSAEDGLPPDADIAADTAGLETPAEWEATLPRLPDGTGRRAAVAEIARSQLGVCESSTDFILSEDGTQSGRSRYGEWYGSPYGDWNAMFAFFCLHYADVPESQLPYGAGCWSWSVRLDEAGLLLGRETGPPEAGDLIFTDTDGDARADRTAIVTEVSPGNAENDGNDTQEILLTTVEGDCEGAVAEQQYLWTDEKIIGWVSVPEADQKVGPSEMPAQRFSARTDRGIQIAASAEEGVFPGGTVMTVCDIAEAEALAAVPAPEAEDGRLLDAVAVDITFRDAQGSELEPPAGSAVQVRITLPAAEQLSAGSYGLLHQRADGTVEQIADADVSETGACFTAEAFSIYVVTSRGTFDEDTATMMVNGLPCASVRDDPNYTSSIVNSADMRYVLRTNEVITITAETDQDDTDYGFWVNNNGTGKLQRTSDGYNTVIEENLPGGKKRVQAKYYGSLNGDCEIVFNSHGTETERLYVTVEPAVNMVTPLGERSVDVIHDFLDQIYWETGMKLYCDEDGNPMYVANGNSALGRINVTPNGEIVLVGYSANQNAEFTVTDGAGYISKYGSKTVTAAPKYRDDAPQMYRIEQRFKAGSSGSDLFGSSSTIVFDGREVYTHVQSIDPSVYVQDQTQGSHYGHSDIEIADGGYYRYYYTETGESYMLYYDADVTAVNSCKLYQIDHSNIYHETKTPINNLFGDPLEFTAEDYRQHGAPGTTQYELTSQDYCQNKPEKSFDVAEVGGARFDVQITLKPRTLVKDGVSYDVSPGSGYPVRFSDLTVSTVFELGYDAVVAAFNKCPNHSGLDFNISLQAEDLTRKITAELEAQKRFTATPTDDVLAIEDGKFQFDLQECTSLTYYGALADGSGTGSTPISSISLPADSEIRSGYQIFTNNGEVIFGDGIDGENFLLEVQSLEGYGDVKNAGDIFGRIYFNGDTTLVDIAKKHLTAPRAVTEDGTNYLVSQDGYYIYEARSFEKIETQAADADGKVRFSELKAMFPGVYYYRIIEQIPDEDQRGGIVYDKHAEDVTITVTRNPDGSLSRTVIYQNSETGAASADTPEFKNTLPLYTLPETGGIGTPVFLLFGTLCIAAAVYLLLRMRQDEAS